MSTNILQVYVQGDFANRQTAEIFREHPSKRFDIVRNINAADCVVWTGGEDIDPGIYNSKNNGLCHYISKDRDKEDLEAVTTAWEAGKKLIGICRGAQLLNCVPNGGTLWQDVDAHNGGPHLCRDFMTSKTVWINSVHHQMMRPGPGAITVAGCELAKEKHAYEGVWKRHEERDFKAYDLTDPEVIWYPLTKSLLFQGHPEFGHRATTEYFHELLTRYILD